MKLFSLLFFILFPSLIGIQNPVDYGNIDYFEIDIHSNLYIIDGAELRKYSPQNELLFTYSNMILGDISNMEVDKSTNLFLYYEDFNKIIFLDNTLSTKYSPIDISELGFAETTLACSSYNNSFWIYDPINQELIRFNRSLQITDRTGNLLNVTNVSIEAVQIIERNNFLYLRDNKNGIFVFDRYGGFLRQMPFYHLDDFYLSDNQWNMLKNDTSFIFNPISLNVDTIVLPINKVKQYKVNDNKVMYLLKSGEFGEVGI